MTFMPYTPRQTRRLTRREVVTTLRVYAESPTADSWLTPQAIALEVGKSRSYVRTLLAELEAEGLARRTHDATDHKTVLWTYNGDLDA